MLRWLTLGALRALAVGFVFVVAVVVGFVVHLGVPAEQRAVVARVNGLLAPVFVGKLTIERVRTLGSRAPSGASTPAWKTPTAWW